MKKLLLASALLVASSGLLASPARAGCDDNVSYAINKYGQCVNLTSFTNLGSLQRQIADLDRQISPIQVRNLHFDSPVEGLHYVKGEAYNQSRRSVFVRSVTLRFTAQVDGETKDLGVEQVLVAERIAPGGSVALEKLLTRERGGSISVASVDAR